MPLALQHHLVMMSMYSMLGVDMFNTLWVIGYIKVIARRRPRSSDHNSWLFLRNRQDNKTVWLILSVVIWIYELTDWLIDWFKQLYRICGYLIVFQSFTTDYHHGNTLMLRDTCTYFSLGWIQIFIISSIKILRGNSENGLSASLLIYTQTFFALIPRNELLQELEAYFLISNILKF